jgi:hypothetical protein
MSSHARLLYLALQRRLSFKHYNNGRVYLSCRDAAAELGFHRSTIPILYRENEHYGFLIQTDPGTIGPAGKAAKYRITDVGWGELDGKRIEATKDYLQWDGVLFEHPKKQKIGCPKRTLVSVQGGHLDPEQPKTEPQVSVQNGHMPEQPSVRPKRTYLDIPSPTVGDEQPIAGIGHNAGPLLEPIVVDPADSRCYSCKPSDIDWRQITALRTNATKCGDSPDPRRTNAELLPPGAPNVPNLPDGGDHTPDDNRLTIPTFLLRGHPDCCVDGNS